VALGLPQCIHRLVLLRRLLGRRFDVATWLLMLHQGGLGSAILPFGIVEEQLVEIFETVLWKTSNLLLRIALHQG